MCKSVKEKIEKLRQELYELFQSEGDIQSEKILEKSRELDRYILETQKQKIKLD